MTTDDTNQMIQRAPPILSSMRGVTILTLIYYKITYYRQIAHNARINRARRTAFYQSGESDDENRSIRAPVE